MEYTELLQRFGLTRQEAVCYLALIKNGECSGYEISKQTGISRSNAYSALFGLSEKGAAYTMLKDNVTLYLPVPIDVFLENRLNSLKEAAETLKDALFEKQPSPEGYVTITGDKNIKDKLRQMIKEAELRIYIAASEEVFAYAKEYLEDALARGLKLVIFSKSFELKGAIRYDKPAQQNELRLITDSSNALTGETGAENSACLFSRQQNLIDLIKESLRNEIILLENKQKGLLQ